MKFGTPDITFCYHLGAHFTGDEYLLSSLVKDRELLSQRGTALPEPKRFTRFLEETLTRYRGEPVPDEDQMELFERLDTAWDTKRVVISDADMLCPKPRLFDHGAFFAKAAYRSAWIRGLFPDNPCDFFLGVCTPMRFMYRYQTEVLRQSFDANAVLKMDLSRFWSEAIGRILYRNPDCSVTVWSYEGLYARWGDVLSEICDTPSDVVFTGLFDLFDDAVDASAFYRGLPSRSYRTAETLARVAQRYPRIPDHVDLAFARLDQGLLQAADAQYKSDLAHLASRARVTFLS